MPEPTTAAVAISSGTSQSGVGVAALLIAGLGPLAGPYAAIVFAALAGALWPLSGTDSMTRSDGAWMMVRVTLTAVVLTAVIANYIQRTYEIPANEVFAPVAFVIGTLGNGWRKVFRMIGKAISNFGGSKSE